MALTALSASSRAMMQEILISLVEIILMLMLLLDRASNINVDIILQSTGRDGKKDISFTCAEGEAETAMRVLKESGKFKDATCDETCAKVSIVGAGMQSNSGVASKMFEALAMAGINIRMISTSEIKISVLINEEDSEKAVKAIHEEFFNA